MKGHSENISKPQFVTMDDKNTFIAKCDQSSGSSHLNTLKYEEYDKGTYEVSPIGTTTVFDVGSYILKKLGPLTTMKLHKLIYYCQAWSLVWDEKPLFNETIEAWANGPVVRDLFSYHRGQYSISNINIGNPDALSDEQRETIDSILDYYGKKTAQWLIELTHMEAPWKDARVGLGPTERGAQKISHGAMAEYYSSL